MVLDLETAGALISGTPIKKKLEGFMETKSIRIRRRFWYDKAVVEVGTIIKVPAAQAAGFVSSNKAEYVPDAEMVGEAKKEEIVIDSMQERKSEGNPLPDSPPVDAKPKIHNGSEKSKKGGLTK